VGWEQAGNEIKHEHITNRWLD